MTNKTSSALRPIRFSRLENGSDFTIFAEPSRGLAPRAIKDTTLYTKITDSYSEAKHDSTKTIILYPEDLVVPRSRGGR